MDILRKKKFGIPFSVIGVGWAIASQHRLPPVTQHFEQLLRCLFHYVQVVERSAQRPLKERDRNRGPTHRKKDKEKEAREATYT